MRLLIQAVRLIDPATGWDGVTDLAVEDGVVLARGEIPAGFTPDLTLDGSGKWLLPGLVDIHVHFREPGQEYKETLASGTRSAVAGGVTSVVTMPNTDPAIDTRAMVEWLLERAKFPAHCRVFPAGGITRGLKGEELTEMADELAGGAVCFTDDGYPIASSRVMRRALEYAKGVGATVVVHEEDCGLSGKGCMNEGWMSTRLGVPGIPHAAEDAMIARDIELARLTGARLHIAHVATAGGVTMIRRAKADGVKVSGETCPHYLLLTDEALAGYNTDAKMYPPLRTAADRDALLEGLRDGTLEAIATDHAPHELDAKRTTLEDAARGVVGVETMLSAVLTLVDQGALDLNQAIDLMTHQPARLMNLPAHVGRLDVGDPADMVLVDPAEDWMVDRAQLHSKSQNTPFHGMTLKGRAVATWVGGKLKHSVEPFEAEGAA